MRTAMPGKYAVPFLIFAAGLVLRLLVLVLCLDTPLFGDALAYHHYATLLYSGQAFDSIRAPGLSLWLAGWYHLFGASQLTAMLAILPFYLILSAAIYLYASRRISERAGLIALALVTFYPAFVFQSVWPLTQVPLAALLILSLYLLDNCPGPVKIASAALLLGFTILVRPNSLTLIPAFALVLLLNGKTRIITRSFLLTAVAMAPALLWSAREYRQNGNLVFINYTNSMNFYLGNNRYTPLYKTWWFGSHGEGDRDVPSGFSAELNGIRRLPLPERDRAYLRLALAEIAGHPARFALRTLSRVRCFFAFDSYTGAAVISRFGQGKALGAVVLGLDMLFYLAIMAAALIYYLNGTIDLITGRMPLSIGIVTAAYAFPFWLAFSHPTYHLPVMPLLALPAAAVIQIYPRKLSEIRDALVLSKLNFKLPAVLGILLLIQLEWVLAMLPSFSAAR